jgi:cell division protease FtsH
MNEKEQKNTQQAQVKFQESSQKPGSKVNGMANNGPNKKFKKYEFKMEFNPRKSLIWVLIALLFAPYFFNLLRGGNGSIVPLSQVVSDVKENKIEQVTVLGQELKLKYKDGSEKKSRKESNENFTDLLKNADLDPTAVKIEVVTPSFLTQAAAFFFNYIFPTLMFGLLLLFIMRRQMGSESGMFAIGKSKAKLFNKGKQSIKFKDVGGLKEAKQELEEIVDFLKNPKKYRELGARVPKGALLVGPSGTGKTMLAKAVAGEAGVYYLSMAGSEFMEMLVGVGASRARDLFQTAKKMAPAIIFIDEIDAIGRMRGYGSMGGHDEREQTLNQILVEMDGFTPNDAVIVLAATNRGDLLDPALVRPGRFDRRVTLDLPDLEERKFILSIHAKNKPFDEEVNWDRIAKRTVGFSGADLENMLNESAILVAREDRKKITMIDLEEAALKVKLGPQKKRLQSEYERKMTAYHEAGHAILAHFQPHTDPVHRISIVSRGMALGFTMNPPETDKFQKTQSELEEEIVVLLGGRTAEKLFFNELTGGASSDIDRATRIARAMVMDYGMSNLGPVNYGPQYENNDYNRAMMGAAKISEGMQEKVDAEIGKIISIATKKAEDMVQKNKKAMDAVANRLLEIETLDMDEFERLVGSKKVKPEFKSNSNFIQDMRDSKTKTETKVEKKSGKTAK